MSHYEISKNRRSNKNRLSADEAKKNFEILLDNNSIQAIDSFYTVLRDDMLKKPGIAENMYRKIKEAAEHLYLSSTTQKERRQALGARPKENHPISHFSKMIYILHITDDLEAVYGDDFYDVINSFIRRWAEYEVRIKTEPAFAAYCRKRLKLVRIVERAANAEGDPFSWDIIENQALKTSISELEKCGFGFLKKSQKVRNMVYIDYSLICFALNDPLLQ